MARRIATGIDIGTSLTKAVIVEEISEGGVKAVRIIGAGHAPTSGMRHGYVVDADDVAASVKQARRMAENQARVAIKQAFLAVGGVSLDESRSTGETPVARADQEITDLDLEKTLEAARTQVEKGFANREILQEIPVAFRIDGERALGDPVGMKGIRLSGDYLFVSCLKSHLDALTAAVESADIEVIDRMASPLAGSYVTLTKEQKMKGCLLANLGAETLSIVVYDENVPISLKVFPLGGASVTEELALAFRISLEDAERLKMGKLGGTMYPKKKVDDLVGTRLRAMFDLIDKHLKVLGKRGALPAGIILSGGASNQTQVLDIAKYALALPAKNAELQVPPDSKVRDAIWAVAYGVALWGLTGDTSAPRRPVFSGAGKSLSRFFQQFLP